MRNLPIVLACVLVTVVPFGVDRSSGGGPYTPVTRVDHKCIISGSVFTMCLNDCEAGADILQGCTQWCESNPRTKVCQPNHPGLTCIENAPITGEEAQDCGKKFINGASNASGCCHNGVEQGTCRRWWCT